MCTLDFSRADQGVWRMKIALWGCGGHASVVLDAARLQGSHEVVAFVDDSKHLRQCHAGLPVFRADHLSALRAHGVTGMVIAIGDEPTRMRLATDAAAAGFTLCTIIHPAATVAEGVPIGDGAVIFAGAIVQPGARIGSNAIINTGASVDHDCLIESGAQLAPRAVLGGRVTIGQGTFIGIGAVVINAIRIGDNCLIGAGSVVVRDIPDDSLAYGVPARIVRSRSPSAS
jgi:sugar O-acyltransferase (sialic acid O-acetyltransferase NeuD family)